MGRKLRYLGPSKRAEIERLHNGGAPAAIAELMVTFSACSKQRIARCDYCWNYFIPKTQAATRYCDRSFGGQSCKKREASLKRKKGPEQDDALKPFKQLRDRMYARVLRYQEAPGNQRDQLIPMTAIQHNVWEENAHQARRDYMAGIRLTESNP